jgi:pimeloyl-ACP methyl ester carboxylesterase
MTGRSPTKEEQRMSQTTDLNRGSVSANGIRFEYLELGDGPLVLLLHGFPDNAWTWSHQMNPLAQAGYRAVAPFMRGYPPTEIPSDGRFDPEALGTDVAELIRALSDGGAFVIGSDWGAVSTYAAMALYPERIRRALVSAAGHPATLSATFNHPEQVQHIFHFWFFQLQKMAAAALRANDHAFVDHLWTFWSADGFQDEQHISEVKRTLAPAGATEAALSYYRALLRQPIEYPETYETMLGKTAVPTLAVFGAEDPPRKLSKDEYVNFDAEYRLVIIEGAGHFTHREQPEQFNSLLLEWLSADH